MVKGGRILLVAAITAGCGRAPAASVPADSWSATGPLDPLTLIGSPFQALSPVQSMQRSVLDTGGSDSSSAQWKALTDQIQNLDKQHQAAFASLIWNDIKDKTQQDLLLQGRRWQQHPGQQLQYLQGLLEQVQGMSAQQADQLGKALPAGALESANTSPTAAGQANVPPALKPAYDALGKRVKALASDRAKALVGQIWQDTKGMTSQQLLAQREDWKAHPDKQLAYMNGIVTTIEQANGTTVESLISDTPDEVFKAAEQATKQAQSDQRTGGPGQG